MTSLPSGLASISARLDDTPNVRGAVAFGQAQAKRREDAEGIALGWFGIDWAEPGADRTVEHAIDRHAALVIGSAYRSADRR